MIDNNVKKRYLLLSDSLVGKPKSVIYVMSRDQRTENNPALYEAQKIAIQHKLPLIVFFNIHTRSKRRLLNQYEFMIEGLFEVSNSLHEKDISFLVKAGNKSENLRKVISEYNPSTLIFDFMPLRETKNLYYKFAADTKCTILVVDAHNIVPAWIASHKQEFSAATFRRKIHKQWYPYINSDYEIVKHPYQISTDSEDLNNILPRIKAQRLNHYQTVNPGRVNALNTFEEFFNKKINGYSTFRNDPVLDFQSGLSPYLHFGTISSHEIIKAILQRVKLTEDISTWPMGVSAFFEEIVVRKELSDNFCFYNDNYDNYEGIPAWAKRSLDNHRTDNRDTIYSYEELDNAKTKDYAWNAAQRQMMITGKMHGYMRMYWAKKILEWTKDPETAIEYAVKLNDMYSLDGYDPNGYAGILWSIGGLHDRPWFNKPIYGMVRYMNYNGLKTKFDIERYINKWT